MLRSNLTSPDGLNHHNQNNHTSSPKIGVFFLARSGLNDMTQENIPPSPIPQCNKMPKRFPQNKLIKSPPLKVAIDVGPVLELKGTVPAQHDGQDAAGIAAHSADDFVALRHHGQVQEIRATQEFAQL